MDEDINPNINNNKLYFKQYFIVVVTLDLNYL
jgi:hypothetical protein